MRSDDRQLAKASRLIRRRKQLRQIDLATPRHVIQAIEAGRAGRLKLDDVRAHFEGLEARARISLWWNGAELDRLFDSRHAAVVEAGLTELRHYGWKRTATEVSFSEYGERGSMDLLGANEDCGALFVGEAKSEWGSVEETLRRLDVKVRLAPKIALQTFGFRPRAVAGVLLLPEDRTARRVTERFAATLDSALPARGREIRAWLRAPSGSLRGVWFLTNAAGDMRPRVQSGRKGEIG